MKRLYLTVEGQTEAAFAMSVLTPHLANFSVFLTPPRFTGLHKRRRGRIPQGGMLDTWIQQKVPGYDENVAGPLIAEEIGLPILRVRCPHFGKWLTILEQLDAGGV